MGRTRLEGAFGEAVRIQSADNCRRRQNGPGKVRSSGELVSEVTELPLTESRLCARHLKTSSEVPRLTGLDLDEISDMLGTIAQHCQTPAVRTHSLSPRLQWSSGKVEEGGLLGCHPVSWHLWEDAEHFIFKFVNRAACQGGIGTLSVGLC